MCTGPRNCWEDLMGGVGPLWCFLPRGPYRVCVCAHVNMGVRARVCLGGGVTALVFNPLLAYLAAVPRPPTSPWGFLPGGTRPASECLRVSWREDEVCEPGVARLLGSSPGCPSGVSPGVGVSPPVKRMMGNTLFTRLL